MRTVARVSDTTPLCGICDRSPGDHKDAEIDGRVHHKFSPNGHLAALEAPPKQPAPAAPVNSVPSDPVLRLLLIGKGIITPEELTNTEQMLIATGTMLAPMPPHPFSGPPR